LLDSLLQEVCESKGVSLKNLQTWELNFLSQARGIRNGMR